LVLVSGSDSKTHLQLAPSFNPFFSPTISDWFQFWVFKTWILVLVWLWFLKNIKNQFGFQTWFQNNQTQFQFGFD
jgi:hypothetical protein